MASKRAHWLWGIACTLLLAWALTLTALYAQERGKQDSSNALNAGESLSLELKASTLALEMRPKEVRVLLHLEAIEWYGLARTRRQGTSTQARKIQRDWIIDTLNETLVAAPGGVDLALYELPSRTGRTEPATVHQNYTVLAILPRRKQEDDVNITLELLIQQPPQGGGDEYSEVEIERLQRPSIVEFYLNSEKHPQLLSCLSDFHDCAPQGLATFHPPLTLAGSGRCTPRFGQHDDSYPLDNDAIARQAFSTGLGLLSLLPVVGKGAKAIDVTTKLLFLFMKKKDSQDDKWAKMRKYVEKYVAAEVAHAVNQLKIRELENAMTGISRTMESYFIYENGTNAKAMAFRSVKTAMEAWYGFFVDKTNPIGSFVHFIPYGNMYLAWRMQEIVTYEEIYGEPLTPQLFKGLVDDLESTVVEMQSVAPAIRSRALEVRKGQIYFEKKTGFFHCDIKPLPWKKDCGNIKVIDEGSGWRSKPYFFKKQSESDEKYHYAHTLLYDLAVRLATFNLQLKLDDFLDASDWWSFMVPDNPYEAVNTTQIYGTGLIGNLWPKAEYIDENHANGGNLTKLGIYTTNGHDLEGIQLWFAGKSKGPHGTLTAYQQSQEIRTMPRDPLDKVCGISEASTFKSLEFSNNATSIGFGEFILNDFYEGWFFDFDASPTLQRTSLCGMKLGLFGRTESSEHVDTMDIAFCKEAKKVRRKSI